MVPGMLVYMEVNQERLGYRVSRGKEGRGVGRHLRVLCERYGGVTWGI